jgi:hypothetical protein
MARGAGDPDEERPHLGDVGGGNNRDSSRRPSPAPNAGIGRPRRCRATRAASFMNAKAAAHSSSPSLATAASSARTVRCLVRLSSSKAAAAATVRGRSKGGRTSHRGAWR